MNGKMNRNRIALIITGLVVIICIVSTWIHYFDLKEKGEEIVKCYDKYNNEIIGEECIETNNYLSASIFISIISLIALALITIAYRIY